ncbi:hypothetical protein [Niastella populi]|uniref:Uncharacterized protein n=1 Tax=Niastella populi TaxID=550983 RepID=A0A1V9FR02_9BACT|nr:hypothetical protein [Niastella populi]OQP60748.1 hypothetical protein A4R26_19250 [Niastella populi]
MTIYKANTKSEWYYIFAYVAVMSVAAFVTGKPMIAVYASGIFIPLIVIYNLFLSRLSEVQVDKEKGRLIFIYRNYIRKKKELVFGISNIEFTYKHGDTYKKNEDKNICTLYNEGKKIVKMRHGDDGWTSDQIFDLIHELKDLGVKRKFTGYMMKDAEV